jgi:putative hydrolase of the HAD superfamily
MPNRAALSVVFSDADNTLWDTNAIFASAQLNVLDRVEAAVGAKAQASDRLAFVREIDQLLAVSHHANLKYPPSLLVASLALTLIGERPNRAVRETLSGSLRSLPQSLDVEVLGGTFVAELQKPPELRAGVREGLTLLSSQRIEVIVITEGSKAKCEKLIARYSLETCISDVLEGHKRPELYKRALAWKGVVTPSFMIGDQLDRDIVPAKAAGLTTVYFPGEFRPHWTPAEAEVRPDTTVDSYLAAGRWIISELARRTATRTAV